MAACWGLGQSVTISSLLGVLSDMCRASQLPLLFGLQLLAEGIGGIALVPLAGRDLYLITRHNRSCLYC